MVEVGWVTTRLGGDARGFGGVRRSGWTSNGTPNVRSTPCRDFGAKMAEENLKE
jgi:hypothetical protein